MNKLKDLRKEKKMSQIDAAKACCVSLNTYCLWERGGGKQNEENLIKLKKVFKIEES